MNIVSVSWGDHLSFGGRDGKLDTPDKVARRVRVWREELGATALLAHAAHANRGDVLSRARLSPSV